MKADLENVKELTTTASFALGDPRFGYQIDCAMDDIAVLDKTRQNVIDRPLIYLLVDAHSRRAAGLQATMGSSSGAQNYLTELTCSRVTIESEPNIEDDRSLHRKSKIQ